MIAQQQQAAELLIGAERAERRSREFGRARRSSPYLLLWGTLWVAAHGTSAVAPALTGGAWIAADVIGAFGTVAIARRQPSAVRDNYRWLAGFLALVGFAAAALAVLPPADPRAVAAFITLVVALAYVLAGIIWLPRLAVAGCALAALTLFGFFALPTVFQAWMAIVGGGFLIGTGLWLRHA